MNRDPIFIRVDASPRTGYERYARCMILAAALQRRRRPTYFLSQLEPPSLAFAIKRSGNDWIPAHHPACTPEDKVQTLFEISRRRPAAVIVDDAEANRDYLTALRNAGVLVVSIDHHAQIRFPAHLVINPLLGPSKESYEYGAGTQLLLNQRYTLVRPEVRRLRPGRAQEPAPILPQNGKPATTEYRGLIALGEDDPHRRVMEYARLLVGAPHVGKIDIIVRREHPDLEQIKALVEENKGRMELALEPAEIAARIVRAHFALTSGSGWSNELACVGVPQLMILQNEAYWPNAQRLEEEGCATCLGWYENVSVQTIRAAVLNLLTDPLERQAMARCGRKLIDGRGPDRFVTALELMLHKRQARELARAA